jgi:hypothetical protein
MGSNARIEPHTGDIRRGPIERQRADKPPHFPERKQA